MAEEWWSYKSNLNGGSIGALDWATSSIGLAAVRNANNVYDAVPVID